MASEEERRSKLLNDYCELRRTHPELHAQLRDFQVKANVAENLTFENLQVDILCSALDKTNSSHINISCPTPRQQPHQCGQWKPEGWEKLRHR